MPPACLFTIGSVLIAGVCPLQQHLQPILVPVTFPSNLLQVMLSDFQPMPYVMLQQNLQYKGESVSKHVLPCGCWIHHCIAKWQNFSPTKVQCLILRKMTCELA